MWGGSVYWTHKAFLRFMSSDVLSASPLDIVWCCKMMAAIHKLKGAHLQPPASVRSRVRSGGRGCLGIGEQGGAP